MLATFDDRITVFNQWYNRETRMTEWRTAHISGASWYGGRKVAVRDNGLDSADSFTVRIPEGNLRGYAPPDEWNALADTAGRWTAQSGDIVARGHIGLQMKLPKDLQSSEKFTVTGCYDNRRLALRHLRIEGK